ncbi:hypothetical protein [Peribacillus asahii]|uniref:hypothetical protein n=1 Tax=Peribacillus asahii TaxID=228899 RepID=UPI00381AF74B
MEILKDWKTSELIEFLNSCKSIASNNKDNSLTKAVLEELTKRQPLIGWSYTL